MPNSFEAGNALVRMAYEATVGHVDPGAIFHDHRIRGISGGDDRALIPAGTLEPGQQMSPGLPSTVQAARELAVAWEPSGLLRYLATFQDKGAAPVDNGAGNAWVHRMAPSETVVTFPDTFTTRIYNDTELVQMLTGCLLQGFTFSATIGGVVDGTLDVQGQQTSYWDLPVVIAGTAVAADRPVLRGIPRKPVWDLVDHEIFVDFTAPLTIRAKVGTAAAFANTQTIVLGTPLVLQDEAGIEIGTPEDPVEIFIRLGAAPAVLLDEYSYEGEVTAAPWTPTLPDLVAFNVINARTYIDAADVAGALPFPSICLNQAVLTGSHPTDPNFCLGERYSSGIQQQGQREITWTINRRHISKFLEKHLVSGEPVAFHMELTSNVLIPASVPAVNYKLDLVSGHCLLEGSTANPSGPDTFEEPMTLRAFKSDDVTFPDDLTMIARNDQADLAV